MNLVRICLWAACLPSAFFGAPVALGAEITIVTYNIHHGEGTDKKLDLDRIARVALAAEPDVICLQEVDRGMARTGGIDMPKEFERLFGMKGVFEPNLLMGNGEYGNATFTRLEIESHENLRLPNPAKVEPRGCLRVTVRAGGELVDVLNTHLGLKPEERLAQAAAIVKFLDGRRAPISVLAGDLNETTEAPGLKLLLGKLKDTFSPIEGAPRATAPSNAPRRRIDFVLASPNCEASEARIDLTPETAVASDHLPYVVKLKLAP